MCALILAAINQIRNEPIPIEYILHAYIWYTDMNRRC